jgi:hypothetical protein
VFALVDPWWTRSAGPPHGCGSPKRSRAGTSLPNYDSFALPGAEVTAPPGSSRGDAKSALSKAAPGCDQLACERLLRYNERLLAASTMRYCLSD